MFLISISMIAVLTVTALIHAAWALGIWWPIQDEKRLAQTVVGTPGIERMPSAMITWGVVTMIAIAMVWIAALSGWVALPLPSWTITLGAGVMAAVFILRATVTYVAPLFGGVQEGAFTKLDRLYFAPLIFLLSLGTLALLLL